MPFKPPTISLLASSRTWSSPRHAHGGTMRVYYNSSIALVEKHIWNLYTYNKYQHLHARAQAYRHTQVVKEEAENIDFTKIEMDLFRYSKAKQVLFIQKTLRKWIPILLFEMISKCIDYKKLVNPQLYISGDLSRVGCLASLLHLYNKLARF